MLGIYFIVLSGNILLIVFNCKKIINSEYLHNKQPVCLLFLQAHGKIDRFFFQIQEFILSNPTVTSSTTVARCSPPSWNLNVEIFFLRINFVLTCLYLWVFQSLVHPNNPVYERRVDLSSLSLPSHRHSCVTFLLSSRFITLVWHLKPSTLVYFYSDENKQQQKSRSDSEKLFTYHLNALCVLVVP